MSNIRFTALALAFVFVLAGRFCSAQNPNDTVQIIKKTIGVVYRLHGEDLSVRELMNIARTVPEALPEMKAARNSFIGAAIMTSASAVLIIWPSLTKTPGSEFNWTPMAIGAGVFVASLPVAISFRKHATRAVEIYNGKKPKSHQATMTLSTGLSAKSFGLRFIF